MLDSLQLSRQDFMSLLDQRPEFRKPDGTSEVINDILERLPLMRDS